MPHSSITSNLLFELEKVKMIRTEHKLYFGEILQKKKEGRGNGSTIFRDSCVSGR